MVKIIDKGLAKSDHPIFKGNTAIIAPIRFTKKKRVKNEKK